MLQLISDVSEFNKYHKCFSYNRECDFELSKYSLKTFCLAIFISDAANKIDQIAVVPGRQGEEWFYILVDLPIPTTFNKERGFCLFNRSSGAEEDAKRFRKYFPNSHIREIFTSHLNLLKLLVCISY